MTKAELTFKVATETGEFEQINRLNHKTFAEEIPQHATHPEGILIDKFHVENTYLICLAGERLVGMIAVRDNRPFSLDQKLENLDHYLPLRRKVCEIRLLAVEKKYRSGRVFYNLMKFVAGYCRQRQYDLALISGTTRQQKLYHHLGFVPFGPLVGAAGVQFQPMYLTLETSQSKFNAFFEDILSHDHTSE
jgi:hypothetical protein